MSASPSADEVFNAALALADPKTRSAYLDRACAGNPSLRHEIESLLAAAERAGTFLESPATGAEEVLRESHDAAVRPLTETAGSRIGRYKLLEQIGEGGFGVVWMAEQEEPVHRRVALKIIKLGMDTREVVARFEAERQALALMDHANIAKVLDGGTTESQIGDSTFQPPRGRPYFVMELVKGIPITRFCDERRLSTRERLELFTQVCHAVQHAHQKGVIHRDLKPSNVLVTVQDDRPVPKVIDFGVAKATQARLTEKTLFTRFHQFIGTPAYMSPEQAGLGSLDVDTRSEIRAWETYSGRELPQTYWRDRALVQIVASPSGGRIGAAYTDGEVCLLDSRLHLDQQLSGWSALSGSTTPLPGPGTQLGQPDEPLTLEIPRQDRRVWHPAHTGNINYIAFSPDEKYLATAAADGSVLLWDLDRSTPLRSVRAASERPAGSSPEVLHLAFGPEGQCLLALARDGTVAFWNVPSGEAAGQLASPITGASSAVFSPDGLKVAVCRAFGVGTGEGRVWETGSGEPITPVLGGGPGDTFPDGKECLVPGACVVLAGGVAASQLWPLVSDQRPLEEITPHAQLLAARELDAWGSLAPLAPARLSNLWHSLQNARPETLGVGTNQVARWHLHEALHSQQARQWSAAAFHLRRLSGTPYDGPQTRQRLAHARAQAALELLKRDP